MKQLFLIFISIILLNTILFSQDKDNLNRLSVYVSSGININNPVATYFINDNSYTKINPGIFADFGIQYGSFKIYDIAQMDLSVSLSYTTAATSEKQLEKFSPANAKLKIETLPILFWSKLKTSSLLSPFVELGVGIAKLNYDEHYSVSWLDYAVFNYWAFCYALGAGVEYKLLKNMDIGFHVRTISIEKEKLVEYNGGIITGVYIRNISILYGLQATLSL